MRAGRLHSKVTVQRRTITQNALGEAIEGWTNLATLRADVRMANGVERYAGRGDTDQAAVDYVLRLRYRSDITPLCRVVFNTKVLDIEAALDPDGKRRDLVLYCRELVGQTAINRLDFSDADNSMYLPLLGAM